MVRLASGLTVLVGDLAGDASDSAGLDDDASSEIAESEETAVYTESCERRPTPRGDGREREVSAGRVGTGICPKSATAGWDGTHRGTSFVSL